MSEPTKNDGRWRIRWFDANGERQSESFAKKADAAFALKKYETEAYEIRKGLRPVPVEKVPRTFGEVADHWLKHRATKKRSEKDDQSIIRRHLRPAFGHLLIEDVTLERIDEWREGLECSDKTEHNVLTLFVSMLRLARDLDWVVKIPKITKPTLGKNKYRWLKTDEEVARFLRAARDHDESTFVLYATAIYTGLRCGELAGMKRDDISFETRLITVSKSFNGPTKDNDVRHVPIVDALLPVLKDWLEKNPLDVVFPNAALRMHQPSARVFQETLHSVLNGGGFPKIEAADRQLPYVTFHGLRHTFASHWVKNGGDIFKLQRILGHSDIKLTMRYSHLAPDAFVADYGRFGQPVNVEATEHAGPNADATLGADVAAGSLPPL